MICDVASDQQYSEPGLVFLPHSQSSPDFVSMALQLNSRKADGARRYASLAFGPDSANESRSSNFDKK